MMHGPIADQTDHATPAASNPLVAALERVLAVCNRTIVILAGLALVAACVILSYSVLGRALFHSPNYLQDQAPVVLLVGATFMNAAYVQGQRRHVAIEAVLGIGISYGVATLLAMFSGMPIAFALGGVAVVFMAIYMPHASLDTVTQNVYEEMASITLLSIPLFILKGAAIGQSRAGQDLYSALHAWLHRIPGGLGVANVFACALFAAMAGSSPATCAAIGSAGIPEMRKRGYSGGLAAGIIAAGGTLGILLPPSITMILFAVAAEKSLGRLFLAGIGPGLLLVTLFGFYAVIRFRKEYAAASALYAKTGAASAILHRDEFTMAERFSVLPRVLPFVLLLTGVMIALYGGGATPSPTARRAGARARGRFSPVSCPRPAD